MLFNTFFNALLSFDNSSWSFGAVFKFDASAGQNFEKISQIFEFFALFSIYPEEYANIVNAEKCLLKLCRAFAAQQNMASQSQNGDFLKLKIL